MFVASSSDHSVVGVRAQGCARLPLLLPVIYHRPSHTPQCRRPRRILAALTFLGFLLCSIVSGHAHSSTPPDLLRLRGLVPALERYLADHVDDLPANLEPLRDYADLPELLKPYPRQPRPFSERYTFLRTKPAVTQTDSVKRSVLLIETEPKLSLRLAILQDPDGSLHASFLRADEVDQLRAQGITEFPPMGGGVPAPLFPKPHPPQTPRTAAAVQFFSLLWPRERRDWPASSSDVQVDDYFVTWPLIVVGLLAVAGVVHLLRRVRRGRGVAALAGGVALILTPLSSAVAKTQFSHEQVILMNLSSAIRLYMDEQKGELPVNLYPLRDYMDLPALMNPSGDPLGPFPDRYCFLPTKPVVRGKDGLSRTVLLISTKPKNGLRHLISGNFDVSIHEAAFLDPQLLAQGIVLSKPMGGGVPPPSKPFPAPEPTEYQKEVMRLFDAGLLRPDPPIPGNGMPILGVIVLAAGGVIIYLWRRKRGRFSSGAPGFDETTR